MQGRTALPFYRREPKHSSKNARDLHKAAELVAGLDSRLILFDVKLMLSQSCNTAPLLRAEEVGLSSLALCFLHSELPFTN